MKTSQVLVKCVLFDGDKILLLRRSNTAPHRPGQWDLPGGTVDEGEDFVPALTREIKEEADLDVNAKSLHLVYTHTAMKPAGNCCWLFFMGTMPKDQNITLSYEHDKIWWTILDEAIESIEYQLQKNLLEYIRANNLA